MAPTGQSAASGIGRPAPGRARPVRVAVVDRHEVVRVGLAALLTGFAASVRLVASAAAVEDLPDAGLDVDVVLLDAVAADAVAVARAVRGLRARGAAVLLYTGDCDVEDLRRSVGAGAAGILPKIASAAATVAAITTVASWRTALPAVVAPGTVRSGSIPVGPPDASPGAVGPRQDAVSPQAGSSGVVTPTLSLREREALTLYTSGLPLKSVARRMTVTEYTAKEYLKRVRRKYGEAGRPANTKLELFWRAVEDGLSRVPGAGGGAVDTAGPVAPGRLAPGSPGRAPVDRSAPVIPPPDRPARPVPPSSRSTSPTTSADRPVAQIAPVPPIAPWGRSAAGFAPTAATGGARTRPPVRLPTRAPRTGRLVAQPAV